jgi:uncharacterized protein YukE
MMSIQVTLKGRVGRGEQRNKTFMVSNIDNSTMTAKTDEAEDIQSTQCKEKKSVTTLISELRRQAVSTFTNNCAYWYPNINVNQKCIW